jgi:hypothetical protein
MIVTTVPSELMVATVGSELVYVNGILVLSVVGAYAAMEKGKSSYVAAGIENAP